MISHNAIMFVTEHQPTEKSMGILNDLATQLAIDPDDTNLHDIIKLQLGTDNLWYKTQEDQMLKMGFFVFSDKPIPTKLKFALDKITTTSGLKQPNILNTAVYALLHGHQQIGSDIDNTHDFVLNLLQRMRLYSEPEDQHIGGFFGDKDFSNIEEIMKTLFNYKKL